MDKLINSGHLSSTVLFTVCRVIWQVPPFFFYMHKRSSCDVPLNTRIPAAERDRHILRNGDRPLGSVSPCAPFTGCSDKSATLKGRRSPTRHVAKGKENDSAHARCHRCVEPSVPPRSVLSPLVRAKIAFREGQESARGPVIRDRSATLFKTRFILAGSLQRAAVTARNARRPNRSFALSTLSPPFEGNSFIDRRQRRTRQHR